MPPRAKRAKRVEIGKSIDLGKVCYIALPGGEAVTSGRFYVVRHEGTHTVHIDGQDPAEFVGVKPGGQAELPEPDQD